MSHVCTRKYNTRALQQTDIGIIAIHSPQLLLSLRVYKFNLNVISQSLNHLSCVELDFAVFLFVHSFEHDHHPIR